LHIGLAISGDEVPRTLVPSTSVNKPSRQALTASCEVVCALAGTSFLRRFGPHNSINLLQ
jgi:hypothetical protein